jgi:hypothetical protein
MSSQEQITNLAQEPSNKPAAEKQLRVLICGSRDWTDKRRIGRYLDALLTTECLEPANLVVIHGGCKGADHHAGMEAKGRGCQVLEFPANWKKHGLSAGPKRNQQMLDEGKPDRVVAFHPSLTTSKGTKDMVSRAMFHGLPIDVVIN